MRMKKMKTRTTEDIINKLYDRISRCAQEIDKKSAWQTKMLLGIPLGENEKQEEPKELEAIVNELEDMIDWIEGNEPREGSLWTSEEWANE